MYNVEKYEQAKKVKDKYLARLFNIDGVVSVGLGLNAVGEPCIRVGVNNDLAPIPESLEGIPVDMVVSGPIIAYNR